MTHDPDERQEPTAISVSEGLGHSEIASLMDTATTAVRAVQELLRGISSFEAKFQVNDIHTNLDREAHEKCVTILNETGIPVISEEERNASVESQFGISELQWIVDPVDGTYNHWRSIPFFGTSVALVSKSEPVLGVIANLTKGDVYTGAKGVPATKNATPIHVSNTHDYARAVIATGIPVGSSFDDWAVGFTSKGLGCFGKVRMFGSAAMALALLAEGAVDAYWESGIYIWDVAAGLAISSAAGAVIESVQLDRFRFDVQVQTPALESMDS